MPRPDACVFWIKLTHFRVFPVWYILENLSGFVPDFFSESFPCNSLDYSPDYFLCFSIEYLCRTDVQIFALAPMRPLRMATMNSFAMVNVEGNAYLILTHLLPFYYSPYSRTDYPVECTVGHISESLYSFRASDTCSICPSSARMTPFYNCVAIISLKNRSHALQSQVGRIM